jgi:sodium transport system permease protein
MRWSIIRLIALRELRDLLRDRRTVFLVIVLPILLYPGIGLAGIIMSYSLVDRTSVVGIPRNIAFPPVQVTESSSPHLIETANWFSFQPVSPLGQSCRLTGTFGLVASSRRLGDYPPLVRDGTIVADYFDNSMDRRQVSVQLLNGADRTLLDEGQLDVLVEAPADFWEQLEQCRRPALQVIGRTDDERSRLAGKRLQSVLRNWEKQLLSVRLRHWSLPENFEDPFEVRDEEQAKPLMQKATDELMNLLVRVLPFLVVMWSLAGALYPAIDLGAGEKERGTLETLLVSPSTRAEIVWGKFLAIWVSSAVTTWWNLLGLFASFSLLRVLLPVDLLRPAAWIWSTILVVPLAALFGSVCLSIGVYARSTKEGQYYLMPLVLATVLLVFIGLMPGAELTLAHSLVPITGVALLQQRLMTAASLDQAPLFYLIPVAISLAACIWLSLHWAISRFKREEVLFR